MLQVGYIIDGNRPGGHFPQFFPIDYALVSFSFFPEKILRGKINNMAAILVLVAAAVVVFVQSQTRGSMFIFQE